MALHLETGRDVHRHDLKNQGETLNVGSLDLRPKPEYC